jgi:enoyl-CoA hydratase
MSDVVIERAAGVAIVRLNRPEVLNALSPAMLKRLCDSFTELDGDPETRVIILTGTGQRAFSAGLDLKILGTDPDALQLVEQNDPSAAMSACRKPIIGALNGLVVTGGFEIALNCDILIASTAVRFADTHVRVGLLPGWGLSQRLSRLVGPYRARQISLTGSFVEAQTALDWGLVNELVAPDRLMGRAGEIAAAIARVDPELMSEYKAMINRGFEDNLQSALAMERKAAWAHNLGVSSPELEQSRRGLIRGATS